ncbi:MAG: c-type cytochrome biogenesis protein CcmI [Marinosulfonomonas sp.]
MSFWIIVFGLGALVAAAMIMAMNLRGRTNMETGHDVRVYKDQLSDIDRDVARGVISEEEAEQSRLEVSRRLLLADEASTEVAQQEPSSFNFFVGAVVAIVLMGGSVLLYEQLGAPNYPDLPLETRIANADVNRANRPDQSAAEAAVAETVAAPTPTPEHLELMEKLRRALEQRPDDLQGHILLAQNEAGIGNFVGAYQAQQIVIKLKGDDVTAADYADLADMMILAAGGYVSPQAEDALTKALRLDPNDGTALYYSGLMFAQSGRPDMSFRVWSPLFDNSTIDDPWYEPIRQQIEMVARDAGIRYELPRVAPLPGPSAQDVKAAEDMSPEDRAEMIQGMVSRLSDRLATEGGPASDWARLIAALSVLNEKDKAVEILTEARAIFAESEADLKIINSAASRAGLDQ